MIEISKSIEKLLHLNGSLVLNKVLDINENYSDDTSFVKFQLNSDDSQCERIIYFEVQLNRACGGGEFIFNL